VGAAVREGMEPAVDAEHCDAPCSDLDHPDGAGGRGLSERDASFARPARAHAVTGVGRRKKLIALEWATASRHSAGSLRSVCAGSSKSQCG
jgi:hypothetical protein